MSLKTRNTRLFTALITVASFLIVYLLLTSDSMYNKINFHRKHKTELVDILDDNPIEGDTIFFIETSKILSNISETLDLSTRQACSVESAARQNPNFTILLLFTKPIDLDLNDYTFTLNPTSSTIKELLKYPNIKIKTLDMNRYVKGTPLKGFLKTEKLQKSMYPVSHTSDVLRYLTLWRFGGIYMDLDVITMKDLTTLGSNFAATESDGDVASSVLAFDKVGIGHQVADSCVKEIRDNFNGQNWGFNGPGVISRVLKIYCKTQSVKDMKNRACKGFDVLPTASFYPIHYSRWKFYFDPDKLDTVLTSTKSSYGVHIWNKLSSESMVYKNKSDVPYTYIAKKYCPNVYSESGDTF